MIINHDARSTVINGLYKRNIGPYTGVQYDVENEFGFRIITYQAYNAMGLIGSEYNGIAILDEKNRSVVCDQILRESTGYFGASKVQFDFVDKLAKMNFSDFRNFVNSNLMTRCKI